MRETIEKNFYGAAYDSLDEYLADCDRPSVHTAREMNDRGDPAHSPEWYGAPSFADALRLARGGWTNPYAGTRAMADTLRLKLAPGLDLDELVYRPDAGGAIDMGVFLSGAPEVWCSWEAVDRAGRQARIVVNTFCSASTNADQIQRKGVAIVAAVECLEAAGIPVEIIMSNACTLAERGRFGVEASVPIKRSDDPIDIPRLSYFLGHVAAFRYLTLAWLQSLARLRSRLAVAGKHGTAWRAESRIRGTIDVPGFVAGEAQIETWIRGVLAAHGVNLGS